MTSIPYTVPAAGTVGPFRRRLDTSSSVAEVLRTLRDDRHPVALSGSWFEGSALVASEPVVVAEGPDGLDPFTLLDAVDDVRADVPGVYGGWIGNLGYRCGALVERLPEAPRREGTTAPDWWLGFYDHVLRRDPDGGWWFEALWTDERAEALESRHDLLAERLSSPPPPARHHRCSEFRPLPGSGDHRRAVATAIEHIHAGDIYQANVCMGLGADLVGDPIDLFCAGIDALAPRHAAFVDQGRGRAIASLSPESFLRRDGDVVTTLPIKGTRRRHEDAVADHATRDELERASKDRAENVMIVDLMRNDLGRVCVPGSIEVPRLFDVEAHTGVWHLVSEVRGRLRPDVRDGALLRASFPPGSVTGAPKVRAMEVIAAIEATGREAYTGSVGMVSPVAGADWNVAIRTFELDGSDEVWLGVGGGIVADSQPSAELEECHVKARPLLEAIGSRLNPS